ncbi:hypothetical protein MCERE19_02763 [Spirosomataceae bacterium]
MIFVVLLSNSTRQNEGNENLNPMNSIIFFTSDSG